MRKKISFIVIGLLTLGLLLGASCGDDGGGGGVIDSVDGSKKLEDLTDEEALEICKDFAKATNKVIDQEVMCTVAALITADKLGDPSACEGIYEQCMEQDQGDFMTCDENDDNSDDYKDCEATVDELDECAQDLLDMWKEMADDLSCSSDPPDEPEDPKSCKKLEEKCPDMDIDPYEDRIQTNLYPL